MLQQSSLACARVYGPSINEVLLSCDTKVEGRPVLIHDDSLNSVLAVEVLHSGCDPRRTRGTSKSCCLSVPAWRQCEPGRSSRSGDIEITSSVTSHSLMSRQYAQATKANDAGYMDVHILITTSVYPGRLSHIFSVSLCVLWPVSLWFSYHPYQVLLRLFRYCFSDTLSSISCAVFRPLSGHASSMSGCPSSAIIEAIGIPSDLVYIFFRTLGCSLPWCMSI